MKFPPRDKPKWVDDIEVDVDPTEPTDEETQSQADQAEGKKKRGGFKSASKLIDDYLDRVDSGDLPQLIKQKEALEGIEIGPELLTILGAPPSAGKTAFASQVMMDACELNPNQIAYVLNAEMSFDSLVRRQLTKMTRIASDKIRFGNLTDEQREQIQGYGKLLAKRMANVEVHEDPTIASLLDLFDKPPGLVIVDYLQKFAPPDADARSGVNQVVSQLRRLAKRGHAILALSATKRSANGKHESNKLDLACFKESAEIEFNADSAYALVDNGPIDEGCKYIRKMTLAHLKNRHGAKVDRELEFHMPRMEFSAPEPVAHPEFNEYSGGFPV